MNEAIIDVNEYHDAVKDLADRCLAAKSIWEDAKRKAAACKADYDALVDAMLDRASESEPETPLFGGDDE